MWSATDERSLLNLIPDVWCRNKWHPTLRKYTHTVSLGHYTFKTVTLSN